MTATTTAQTGTTGRCNYVITVSYKSSDCINVRRRCDGYDDYKMGTTGRCNCNDVRRRCDGYDDCADRYYGSL